jgi:hypothetical protein
MAAGIVLVAMVALALPVLRVRRDLQALRDQVGSLASQVVLVRQEIQVLRGHLEALATAIAGRTLRDIQAQATIPDKGTGRGEAKARKDK